MEVSMEAHGGSWSSMELRGGLHGVPDNVGRRLVVQNHMQGSKNNCKRLQVVQVFTSFNRTRGPT